VVSVALIGVCVIASTFKLLSLRSPSKDGPPQLRRSLTWADHRNRLTINPVVKENIKPVSTEPDPSQETVMYWHIPKSGGTTLKSIYKCMKQTLTVRVGVDPRFGHDKDEELVVFEPGQMGVSFVNVDTLSRPGILRSQKLGLVPSGLADIMIVTNNLNFAIEHLYDEDHKGRVIALFRHPVERLISKFYYSQVATWERSYRPEWADIDLQYWADNINNDHNSIVKTLAGIDKEAEVTETDFSVAVRTVEQRFIVGLMNQMEESIHRFNIFMGIDESEKSIQVCMDEYFGHGVKKSNSNSHREVDEKDPAWQKLAKVSTSKHCLPHRDKSKNNILSFLQIRFTG